MNNVQFEQTGYEMPPREGFTVAHFSLSPTSTDQLDFTKRYSEVVF
jgi:hypothetical protein